jgi:hypothetical protein
MGIPFLDLRPTAHQSNSTSINSGCESKAATTSGLFQPIEGRGHSKETVPPSFKTHSARLVKLLKSLFDSRSWSANLFIKAAPPFLLLIYCQRGTRCAWYGRPKMRRCYPSGFTYLVIKLGTLIFVTQVYPFLA